MKVYAVGGSVRDFLMGVESKDNDYVVVGSTPEEMISLGYQQVGADFPVFLHPETKEEYALARTERKVGTGYNGFACVFSPDVTLEDDLSRRDLTINAIARDIETGEIIDPFNGRGDIASKTLRHVSAAFSDDPLRVVRLARFYARFGFGVDHATADLACAVVDSGEMNHITAERYWAELMKVFSDNNSNIGDFFSALRNFGVLKKTLYFTALLGEFNKSDLDVGFYEKCAKICTVVNPELRAALFVALFENNATLGFLKAVPNRVRTLVENFRKTKLIDFSKAEEIYGIIAATRSLNETTQALMDLASCLRRGGVRSQSNCLLACVYIAHHVKSDDYMHLSGVEIGKAMKAERIKNISERLNK